MSKPRRRTGTPQNHNLPALAGKEDGGEDHALDETDSLDVSALSFRQQAALPVVATAPTLSQAARTCGVDENTLRRWLKQPLFADRLDAFRQQALIVARDDLRTLAHRGMSVFADAMEDPDPAIRLRAARYAMSYTVQLAELQTLGFNLQELNQLLAQSKIQENA